MADAPAIRVRIDIPEAAASERLRATLEQLAEVLADEQGDEVEGFMHQPSGGLAVGPNVPMPPMRTGGKAAGGDNWMCIGNWVNDDGTGTCTIEFG